MKCRIKHLILAWAHPRGCGEHVFLNYNHWLYQGSSPRVRGTSDILQQRLPLPRLIPAGAGNIFLLAKISDRLRAHPRGCGEHIREERKDDPNEGSSPRVRGTLAYGLCDYSGQGLIPAGAGNILSGCFIAFLRRAHPRGCGEHSASSRCVLVRGGLIPAGAGNMQPTQQVPYRKGAHPRGCGEHTF